MFPTHPSLLSGLREEPRGVGEHVLGGHICVSRFSCPRHHGCVPSLTSPPKASSGHEVGCRMEGWLAVGGRACRAVWPHVGPDLLAWRSSSIWPQLRVCSLRGYAVQHWGDAGRRRGKIEVSGSNFTSTMCKKRLYNSILYCTHLITC